MNSSKGLNTSVRFLPRIDERIDDYLRSSDGVYNACQSDKSVFHSAFFTYNIPHEAKYIRSKRKGRQAPGTFGGRGAQSYDRRGDSGYSLWFVSQ